MKGYVYLRYVYLRGNTFYVGFFDRAGKEIQRSTGIRVGAPDADKRAKKALRLIEDKIAAGAAVLSGEGDGPLTVAIWAKKWIKRRKSADIATWSDDDGRLRLHVVPTLGAMKLDEVRPRHIVELLRTLKTKPCQRDGSPLAPRTVRHVYTTLRAFFRDAITDELIDRNPLDGVNAREVLPAKIDKDPEWPSSAHFSADEVKTLVTDERIPWDRRAFYAVMFLAGLRFGEVSRSRGATTIRRSCRSLASSSPARTTRARRRSGARRLKRHDCSCPRNTGPGCDVVELRARRRR